MGDVAEVQESSKDYPAQDNPCNVNEQKIILGVISRKEAILV